MADYFSTWDALRNLNNGNLPIIWGECKESLEGRKTVPSYLEGLCLLWSKAETRDTHRTEGVVYTDSVHDLKRSKTVCKDLDIKWDECMTHLENKNTDAHYLEGIRLIWQNVEEKNTRKREREKEDDPDNDDDDPDGDDSDEDDSDGDDIDPQYENFLANLKEHDRSYALEVDNNGETSLLPYELEGVKGKRKRKMHGVELADVLSSEMVDVLNNTEMVDRHGNICVQCSGSIMDPRVRENEVSNRKSVTGLVIENQMKPLGGSLNVGTRGVRSKTVLQKDKAHADKISDQMDKQLLKTRYEKGEPSTINMLKGQRKLRKVVERTSGNVLKKAGEKDNMASEKGVEHVAKAPLAGKGKTRRKIFKEPTKEKSVTLENKKHLNQESSTSSIQGEAGFQIRKQFLNQKFGLGVSGVEEIQDEFVGKAQANDHRVVSGKKLKGIIEIESYRKLCPITKLVKENQVKHVDQNGPVTKDAANSGMKLKAMVKIGKPIPKRNSVEGTNCEHVDEDCLVKKHGANGLVQLRKRVKEEKISNGKNVAYAQKTTLRTGGTKKKKLGNSVQVGSGKQHIHRKLLCKNTHANDRENDNGDSSDVKILKNGAPFFQAPVTEDMEGLCNEDMNTKYAKNLMSILKEPFNKKTYKKLSDEAKVYYRPYPSLEKKLTKYRYKVEKRFNVLRGLFYWLQHCRADGAFRPWENKECLGVKPGMYPENTLSY